MNMVPIFGWLMNNLTPITAAYVKQVFLILRFCGVFPFSVRILISLCLHYLIVSYYLWTPIMNFLFIELNLTAIFLSIFFTAVYIKSFQCRNVVTFLMVFLFHHRAGYVYNHHIRVQA